MEEEIQIINENTKKEKIKNFFIKNGKYFIFSISSLIILVLAYFVYIEIQSKNQVKLAEKFNRTVYNFQNLKNVEQTKKILVEIIEKKKFNIFSISVIFYYRQ